MIRNDSKLWKSLDIKPGKSHATKNYDYVAACLLLKTLNKRQLTSQGLGCSPDVHE